MANVGLILSNPKLTHRNTPFGGYSWRLTIEATVPWTQRINLHDGRKLGDLEGTVGFESDEGEAYNGFKKGSLTYWKGRDDPIDGSPPSYLLTIRMPAADLDRLMRTMAGGMPLRSLNFDAKDLRYGFGPGEAEWDVEAHRGTEVEGFTLFFGQPEEEEIVPDPVEEAVDTDMKSLVAIRELHRTMRYVLYALVALVVVALVRR